MVTFESKLNLFMSTKQISWAAKLILIHLERLHLLLSYRNQPADLHCKSSDWFLCEWNIDRNVFRLLLALKEFRWSFVSTFALSSVAAIPSYTGK